jgi:hypothetical protein
MKFTLENFELEASAQSIKLAEPENRDFSRVTQRVVVFPPTPPLSIIRSLVKKKKLVRIPIETARNNTHKSITIHFLEYDLFYVYDVACGLLILTFVGFRHNFIARTGKKGSAKLIINLNCFRLSLRLHQYV